jgi:hypothetical protein
VDNQTETSANKHDQDKSEDKHQSHEEVSLVADLGSAAGTNASMGPQCGPIELPRWRCREFWIDRN